MNNDSQAAPSAAAKAPQASAPALAIATIPMQNWETPYSACQALYHGTIFPGLDLPFYKTGGEHHG